MRRRSAERGEGNTGCILWALVLLVVVFLCWKIVPVKIASAQFYDFMDEQAKYAGHSISPEEIAQKILWKAQELKLPLTKEGLKVERLGDNIRMEAVYTVPVDLIVTTYQWRFDHQIDRPIFIF